MTGNEVPDDLIDLARRARQRAYAPYSRFKVGAAIRGRGGRLYAGCNVENAAYPQGCCAEAAAIAAMIVDGETAIAEVAVLADGPELITPCGGCRQRLREFAPDPTPVYLCGPEGHRRTVTLGELLPLSFGPAHLE